MLPRVKKLPKRLFTGILKKGMVFSSRSGSVSCREGNTGTQGRFSVVVLRGVAKNSPDRNKIRRRAYAAIKKNYSFLPKNKSAIFFIKKNIPFKKMEEEIINLMAGIK